MSCTMINSSLQYYTIETYFQKKWRIMTICKTLEEAKERKKELEKEYIMIKFKIKKHDN